MAKDSLGGHVRLVFGAMDWTMQAPWLVSVLLTNFVASCSRDFDYWLSGVSARDLVHWQSMPRASVAADDEAAIARVFWD